MFAYCENDPTSYCDLTGYMKKYLPVEADDSDKPEDTISTSLRKRSAKSRIGFQSTTTKVVEIIRTADYSYSFYSSEHGVLTTYVEFGFRSDSIIVFSADVDVDHPFLSSTIGERKNVGCFTFGSNIGFSDTSILFETQKGNMSDGIKLRLDLSERRIGFEKYNSVNNNGIITTSYSYYSINATPVLCVAVLLFGLEYEMTPSFGH